MEYEVVLLDSAETFLAQLSPKFRAKAIRTIELLGEFGPQPAMPHAWKLTGYDLWELRVRLASDICRLFYFYHRDRVYIVTSGYVKKADRTSVREIEKAARLRRQLTLEEE